MLQKLLGKRLTLVATMWPGKTTLILFLFTQFVGCTTLGPSTVARDRFDYVTAVSESWKRQTLLNLVKTRYADAPVFMDVTSVINQYAVESQVQLGASWSNPPSSNSQNLGGSATYTDRPTITYAPLTGEKFTKSLMTPIPVRGVLFLLQSGYGADYVLRICVHTINGIENSYGGSFSARAADRRFSELITSLARIQNAGGMGMRMMPLDDTNAFVMFFRPMTDPAINKELRKAKELLGLSQTESDFTVSYGSFADSDTEVAILSRSMLQVMVDISSYIDVPEDDVIEGRVNASKQNTQVSDNGLLPLINVRCSDTEPQDSYVAVPYRGHWFWIDDRDYPSKRIFNFLMFLFSITETGTRGIAPIVTVPTN